MSSIPADIAANCRDRFPAVYRVLEEAIEARAFPGCAFGVLAGGQQLLSGALGRFTYEADAAPVLPSTVFDVASITKVVATTAMAMLLHQRGQLDLDTLVADLLPGFIVGREPGSLARRVTLRHLLAHNSGLPAYVEFFRTQHTPSALFHACLQLPIEAEPATRAAYSDPGYILLGKALEILAQERMASFLARELFRPLQLHSTCFRPAAALRTQIPPTEQDTWFRHRLIQGEVQDENAAVLGGISGHAGLFSTVPDLLRFSLEVLRATDPAATSIFAPDTVTAFAERQPPAGSSRAIGWDTPSPNSSAGSHFSQHSIGHLGFSGCSLWIDLDARVAAVLLTNRTWPDRTSQLIRQVRPAFHNALREALRVL
jgi:CubicO group peptidase (beta-lactamase class C family)